MLHFWHMLLILGQCLEMFGPYSKPLEFVSSCKTGSLSSNWFNETVQRYHGQMILSYCHQEIVTRLCKECFWPMAGALRVGSNNKNCLAPLILLGKSILDLKPKKKSVQMKDLRRETFDRQR